MSNDTVFYNNQSDTLIAQILAFGYLGQAFYTEPTAEFINTLVTDDLFADWPLEADNSHMQTGLGLLRGYGAQWNEDQLPQLTRDYYRLFIGPDIKAPPWESVWLSREQLLFDEQTMEVRAFYRRFGLQAPKLNNEPDDHLGLELGFIAHLNTLALASLEKNNTEELEAILQAQREFLSDHLLLWASTCLERVIKHAATDYYRGIAHLTLGSLAELAQTLEIPYNSAGASA